MKVRIKGKGDVTLSRTDFLAQGGEGAVYARGSTAYKIYTNPKHMIPLAKIDELSTITLPNVIRPQDVLLDGAKPVGYTMRYVTNTYALCQLFTKAFKQRNNVSDDQILKLVQALYTGVQHVHAQGILIVDLNEMNFLVDAACAEVYFIDVDSYQTRSFPATALMDSVKDWHVHKFSEQSDWFSWGVVTFQLFMGVHPYKGKHPSVKTLEDRMKANLSVFNPDVSIPQMCPPFDTIPEAYRRWYQAVFESGLREPPPRDAQVVAVLAPIVSRLLSTDQLEIVLLAEFPQSILRFLALNSHEAVLTSGGAYVAKRMHTVPRTSWLASCACTGNLLAVWRVGAALVIKDLVSGEDLATNQHVEDLMTYDGRVYCKNNETVFEMHTLEVANRRVVTFQPVANAMPQATKLFEGVALQDMLGAWYASIFPATNQSYQVHLRELRGYKLIDAKYDGRVLMVIGARGGQYDKFIFVLQPDFQNYHLRILTDVQHLSFVTLENGICAYIAEDGKLELFSVAKPEAIKVIEDPILSGGMTLYKHGTQVLLAQDNKLFHIATRKSTAPG